MSRRGAAFVATVALSVIAVGTAAGYALVAADSGATEQQPTALAQINTMPVDLRGTILVGWRTAAGEREHEIALTSDEGAVFAQSADRLAVGGGSARWLLAAEDWLTLSASDPRAEVPGTTAKYDLVVGPGEDVAGRAATEVEATVRGETHPAQSVVLDDEFGFVLARTWFDGSGSAVRWVRFIELEAGPVRAEFDLGPGGIQGAPENRDDVDDPYTNPSTLPGGFALVGIYEHLDGLVQLHYSDGLASISVFEQPGLLDLEALPAEYAQSSVDGHHVYEWVGPAGRMLVWEDDRLVYTLVGEAAEEDLRVLAGAVDDESESVVEQITDSLLSPFGLQ